MRNAPLDPAAVLQEVSDRLLRLEHQAELIKTVLIVREPETVHAANAFEGLRKQVVAAAAERRSHLNQLVSMAVAAARATSVGDLEAQVAEWLNQAGVRELHDVPDGARPQDVFENLEGASLEGATSFEVVEPAYVDERTGMLLRLGRVRSAVAPPTGIDADRSEAGS